MNICILLQESDVWLHVRIQEVFSVIKKIINVERLLNISGTLVQE
jgi:hypothetical protein